MLSCGGSPLQSLSRFADAAHLRVEMIYAPNKTAFPWGEGRFEYPVIQSSTQPSPLLGCFFVRFVCFIIFCITSSKSNWQTQNPQIFIQKKQKIPLLVLFLKR